MKVQETLIVNNRNKYLHEDTNNRDDNTKGEEHKNGNLLVEHRGLIGKFEEDQKKGRNTTNSHKYWEEFKEEADGFVLGANFFGIGLALSEASAATEGAFKDAVVFGVV